MTEREMHILKMRNAIKEVRTASGVHKKDLIRYVYRLKKELVEYDRYHQMLGQYNAPLSQRGD